MTLAPGTKLGPYEILSPLGAGGMGEVWKAKDVRLDRLVAIKVLPEHLVSNPDALGRFEREAKAVAALNHANITGLFDIGREGATAFAVLELLEGESLRTRLVQGPLSPRLAIDLATQLAHGLAAAHAKGVIHRDLKPDNLWITKEGRLKILDFGLAKNMAGPKSGSSSLMPTEAMAAGGGVHTEEGMILGTLGYMSPEQVRGEAVDARSDLFSFGVVLFEMLTGRKAFARGTSADTLAAILKEEPPDLDPASQPIPAGLQRILHHCLEKQPARRFHDAQDLAFALENLDSSSTSRTLSGTPQIRRGGWLAAGAGILVLAAGIAWLWPRAEARPLRKLQIPVVELRVSIPTPPVLSPDGRHVAYVAGNALWVRDLDQLEARKVVDGGRPTYPTWSPDSSELAYISQKQLLRVPARGGAPVLVGAITANIGGQTPGLAWLSDGRIAFSPASSGSDLLVIPAQGGDFTTFMPRIPGQDSDFHKPSVLPDGRSVLVVVDASKTGANSLAVWSGGKRKEIFRVPDEQKEFLDAPVYAPSGHILFERTIHSPGIWALPFSLAKLEVQGPPFLVAPGGHWPSVSRDGSLLYTSAYENNAQLVLVDRNRKIEVLSEPAVDCWDPCFSPDGDRIAWCNPDLTVTDLRRRASTRLTFDGKVHGSPSWTGKGERIFFAVRPGGMGWDIQSVPANGGGEASTLPGTPDPEGRDRDGFDPWVSRDGHWVLYARIQTGRGMDIFAADLQKGGARSEQLSVPGNQRHPTLSPDGNLLLYQGSETGRDEIHLRSFPAGSGHWQVSTRGGTVPRWSAKGDRIYFVEDEALMEVDVVLRPAVQIGSPRKIFALDSQSALNPRRFDVSPDGKLFAFGQEVIPAQGTTKFLTLVENWNTEFAGRVPK